MAQINWTKKSVKDLRSDSGTKRLPFLEFIMLIEGLNKPFPYSCA